MPLNIKAFQRAMKKAAEEKKKAALTTPTPAPVTAKAPVVAPKKEEQPELKSNLTQDEIDAYVRLAFPNYKKQPSMTDIIIKRKLAEMGLEPVKH